MAAHEHAPLPDDAASLRELVIGLRTRLAERESELDERDQALAESRAARDELAFQLAQLKRLLFGRRSEKLQRAIEQFELQLEDLEALIGAAEARRPAKPPRAPSSTPRQQPVRRPLPAHLPREEIVHPVPSACACCGGALVKLGEDTSEVLELVPARLKVIRHVRPKMSCRKCETIAQAPAPRLPISGGLAGPALLAHVLVSKFRDHLPLYRQAAIFAREGIDLDRSTLGGWVGHVAWLLEPLTAAIGRHVLAGERVHADETTVPVLAPGQTKTGRIWVYVRDDRPFAGPAPPAAFYRYSPDRRGEHPQGHLATYAGILQADAYAGFNELYKPDADDKVRIVEAACWAHYPERRFMWSTRRARRRHDGNDHGRARHKFRGRMPLRHPICGSERIEAAWTRDRSSIQAPNARQRSGRSCARGTPIAASATPARGDTSGGSRASAATALSSS